MIKHCAPLALALSFQSAAAQPFAHTYPETSRARDGITQTIRDRIAVAEPWMQSGSAQAMIEAARALPPRARRWLYTDRTFGENTFTMDQHAELPPERTRRLQFFGVSEIIYYTGLASDAPFVEFRAFDMAFQGTAYADADNLAGARVLIVDPTVITHAWALAKLGAHVTVATNNQRFRAMYNAPSDQGTVRGIAGRPDGSVTIVDTNWPAEGADASPALVGPFDLIVALNSLNIGRTDPNPSQVRHAPAPEAVKPLAMDATEAAGVIGASLKPGGRAMLYSWALPPVPNADLNRDPRPSILPAHAEAAGLTAKAFASDASVLTSMMVQRTGSSTPRRPIDRDGAVTAPELEAFYAVYDKPRPKN